MWRRLAFFILSRRFLLLGLIFAASAAAGWYGRKVRISYNFPQVVPTSDSVYRQYLALKDSFGHEETDLLVVVEDPHFFSPHRIRRWYRWHRSLTETDGVEGVTSVFSLRELRKDPLGKRFTAHPVWKSADTYDSADFRRKLQRLLVYHDLIYTSDLTAFLFVVKLDPAVVFSPARETLIHTVRTSAQHQAEQMGVSAYISGVPYIRTVMAQTVRHDLLLFLILSVLMTAGVLTLFFRSVTNVLIPITVIGVVLTFVTATLRALDYEITLLISLVPSVIAIIAVPNFIYFLNRYHREFRKLRHKAQALIRTVEKIGPVALMTNLTTAIGFGVLGLVDSPILREFGQVAAINIFLLYVVSMILLPVFFVLLPAPSDRKTRYLDNPAMRWVLHQFQQLIFARRAVLWTAVTAITAVAVYGMTRLQVVSRFMDNVPHTSDVYRDFAHLEARFGGIFSFDALVVLKDPKKLYQLSTWQKLDSIQQLMNAHPQIGRTYSPVNLLKYLRQVYYNGNPQRYDLPTRREWVFLTSYFRRSLRNDPDSAYAFRLLSPHRRMVRIAGWIPDIGSQQIGRLVESLQRAVPPSIRNEFEGVTFSGMSVIFRQNAKYLLNSLGTSVVLAIVLIAALLGWMFRRPRMIFIVLVANFLPLIWMAGFMGLFGIPLNASSIVVFSISLGIGIDDALHFLARYRQEMRYRRLATPGLVRIAFHETSQSMTYTSLALAIGFAIFIFSSFGGIKVMGQLVALAMVLAYIANLLMLPALLLTIKAVEQLSERAAR